VPQRAAPTIEEEMREPEVAGTNPGDREACDFRVKKYATYGWPVGASLD